MIETIALVIKLARFPLVITGAFAYTLGFLLGIVRGMPFDLHKCLFGYLIFFLAHLSVSFSNDYFDFETDKHSSPTGISGGSGILLSHPELRGFAITFAVLLITFSILASSIFCIIYQYPIGFLIFTIAGALIGYFYTAPPLKFAYRGLGELSSMFGLGMFMIGMGYFVGYGMLDLWYFLMCFPFMCYGLVFILTVEMPDIEGDRVSKKINFLVANGVKKGAYLTFIAAILGTLSLFFLSFGMHEQRVNLNRFVLFSLIPLACSVSGLRINNERIRLIKQAKLNLASLVAFLLLANMSLLLQQFADV